MWRTVRGRRVTKNLFWCLFGTFFYPAEATRWMEKEKKKKARNPRWCMSVIEWICVYSHRTMLSNWGIIQIQSRQEDVWSVFCSKSTVVFTKSSTYVCMCMLKTRFMRMFSMFALKDCYWVSPGVFSLLTRQHSYIMPEWQKMCFLFLSHYNCVSNKSIDYKEEMLKGVWGADRPRKSTLPWMCGLGSRESFSSDWSVLCHLFCLWTFRTPLTTSLFCLFISSFFSDNLIIYETPNLIKFL